MPHERRSVITGIGLLCPLGETLPALHDGLCGNGLGPPAPPPPGPLPPDAPDRHLDGRNAYPLDRPARLLAAAARLALSDSGWPADDLPVREVGLVVGTMFSSAHTVCRFDCQLVGEGPAAVSPFDFANTVINAPAGQAAIWHGLRGVNKTVATGSSSGLEAIAWAAETIRNGRADCLLAGGFEELSHEAVAAFGAAGLLRGAGERAKPFDRDDGGLALSEGAALVMLEEAGFAARRGARVVAAVLGHGHAFDTSRRRDEGRSLASICRSMLGALDQAGIGPDAVDLVCASANGSPHVDRHEALALATVFELGTRPQGPPISAIKAYLGESLGAAGPLQCAAMIESMRRGVVPAPVRLEMAGGTVVPRTLVGPLGLGPIRTCLVNSLGLDGHSSSLVLASAAA